MGRIRVQLAVSADGFIAPVDHSLAWLEPFPAGELGFAGFLRSLGAVLIGRTSYDEVRAMGLSPCGTLPTWVLTSRPLGAHPKHVHALPASRLADKVDALRAAPKDVWLFGGGQTVSACLERRLVDTLELAVIPRLLGSGTPLFAPRAPTLDPLRLVRARPMKRDVLWLEYEVPRQALTPGPPAPPGRDRRAPRKGRRRGPASRRGGGR